MTTEVMAMIPETDPLMIAWKSYSATDAYTNTRGWAADKMHVDGSLWASFCAGWYAAQAKFCNMQREAPAVDGCQLSGEKCGNCGEPADYARHYGCPAGFDDCPHAPSSANTERHAPSEAR